MRETDEMQGRPKKKKGQFGNAKHRICTANYLRAVLTMRVDKLIVADALFLVLAQLILASASTFALSLTVKIIVPSFVSQAILSNYFAACVSIQMPPSCASVQKILGYKCIAPGCGKMFDSRKGYNVHRSKRCYEGTACADIRNGRQLISRGAASGDRPKLFSISIAPQHGMMPRLRLLAQRHCV